MPNRLAKRAWKYLCGKKAVNRIRVTETRPGAPIRIEWFDKHGKRQRRSFKSLIGRAVYARAEAVQLAEYFAMNFHLLQDDARRARLLQTQASPPRIPVERIVNAPLSLLTVRKMNVDPLGGVYLLLYRDEVVYVGQSADMMVRLSQHRRYQPVTFDAIAFIEVYEGDRLIVEQGLIERFRPAGNKTLSSPTREPRP